MFSHAKNTSYKIGLWAETFAAYFLLLKGYKILCRRYKTSLGEIDIIATRGSSLHFIEVKKRTTQEKALYSLSRTQRQRIEQAAEIFLTQTTKQHFDNIFFDVIIMYRRLCIKHMIGAWQAGE